jgi:hypothetical protein
MQRTSMMLAGLSVAALLAPGNSGAQERLSPVAVTYTPTISFGMIGLGTGVTARLNVVNLVRTPPPIAIAQTPCKVELDLYDNQGKMIKQKTVANLGYGQADFLDLLRSELATTAAHVDISGVVKVGSSQSYFCSISATLEVFDNVTGTTSAILTGINSGPVPFLVTPLPVGAQPQ